MKKRGLLSVCISALFLFSVLSFVSAESVNLRDSYNYYNTTTFGNATQNLFLDEGIYSDLISYWSFDLDDNVTAYDINKNHNGNYSGDAYSGNDSVYGKGLILDGSGDMVSIGNLNDFQFTNDNWTMGLWFKAKSFPANSHPIGKGTSIAVCPYTFWLSSNSLRILVGSSGCSGWNVNSQLNDTGLSLNTWYHYVLTKDGTNFSLYRNGNILSSYNSLSSAICNNTLTFRIGSDSGNTRPFNGTIDDVIVFNRSINSTEVNKIYTNQSSRFSSVGEVFIKQQSLNSTYNRANVSLTNHLDFLNQISFGIDQWRLSYGYNTSFIGALGYWTFDSISSTTSDLLGVFNATINNDSLQTAGIYDEGMSCDGENDYASIVFNQLFNMTRISNPDEWTKYGGESHVITHGTIPYWDYSGATFASIMNDSGQIKMWYHGWNATSSYIGYANSSDGLTFTKPFSQPVFSPNMISEKDFRVPMVWKEGSEYHMIYTYMYNISGSLATGTVVYGIGHANSSDGITWQKDSANPVLNYSQSISAIGSGSFEDCFGIMKAGNMYYMTFSGWGERQVGIANSTNLSHFEINRASPLFATNNDPGSKFLSRFCPTTFQYDGVYYILVPTYDSSTDFSWLILYNDSDPAFTNPQYVRVAATPKINNYVGDYTEDLDTPWVLTDITNIQRNLTGQSNMWVYYATDLFTSGWGVSLIQESLPSALSLGSSDWINGSEITIAAWVKFNGTMSSDRVIFGKGNKDYFLGVKANSGKFVFGDSKSYQYTALDYNDSEWHFVTARHTGTNLKDGLQIFVDGEQANTTLSGVYFNGFFTDNSSGLGICGISTGGAYFNGSIDDLLFFNRSLSNNEIKDLYLRGRVNWSESLEYQNYSGESLTFNISADSTNYLPKIKMQSDEYFFSSPSLLGTINLLNFIEDTTAPVINLTSPSDGYSETTSSATINFQFNVSDQLSNVEYCSVFLDGTEHANTSAISESEVNTISISSIGTGSHSWYVYCNDTLGNSANSTSRSFTISAATTENTTTSGGGLPIYSPTESNLREGYSKQLHVNWKIKFNFGDESHQLKLVSFNSGNKTATIMISSNQPQTKTISVGEEWKVNLNNDSSYDLLIRLNNITLIRADVYIRSINETIPEEPINETIPEEPRIIEVFDDKDNWNIEELLPHLYLVAVSLFIILAIIIFFIIRKKREKRTLSKRFW